MKTFWKSASHLLRRKSPNPILTWTSYVTNLGMSRSQAYKKVKSISGFAINEFIIQMKLKRAAKMLIETSMNISEIANTLGFNDHSHMNRHFRKAFSCSPKAYRKKHASKSIFIEKKIHIQV